MELTREWTRWWRFSLGGRGAHETGELTRWPLGYLLIRAGGPLRYLFTRGIVGELGARGESTSWLGRGAHVGVYEVVAPLWEGGELVRARARSWCSS